MTQIPLSKADLECLPAHEVTRIVREVLGHPGRIQPWHGFRLLDAAVNLLEFLDATGEPPAYLMVSPQGADCILDGLNAVRLPTGQLKALHSLAVKGGVLDVPVAVCAMPLPSTMVAVGGDALWWGDGSLFVAAHALALTTVDMGTLDEQLAKLAGADAPSGGIKCACGEWIVGPQSGPLDVVMGGCLLYRNRRCSS